MFKNPDNLPLKELPEEAQQEYFSLWLSGQLEELYKDGSYIDCGPLYEDAIYRPKSDKPYIDWNHVLPQFQWLAVDQNGCAGLFQEKPRLGEDSWMPAEMGRSNYVLATIFTSFKDGVCDWKESLVERPQ